MLVTPNLFCFLITKTMMPLESERWFIDYFHEYFTELEHYCLSKADYNLKITIMLSKKGRRKIPEWIGLIDSFMDYDSDEHREHKMSIYEQWVSNGYGADFYIETEDEDEHVIDIDT